MAQSPKKKLLEENIEEQSDAEIAEKLFGKAAKEELDRLIDAPKKSMAKPESTEGHGWTA